MKQVKRFVGKVKMFAKDESGVSGIVVAIALIVLGVLGGYYVYTQNLQPTLSGASSSGTALQTSGSAASTDWGSVK